MVNIDKNGDSLSTGHQVVHREICSSSARPNTRATSGRDEIVGAQDV
jgi:hypothetical protein